MTIDYNRPLKTDKKDDHVFGKSYLLTLLDRTKRELRRKNAKAKRGWRK